MRLFCWVAATVIAGSLATRAEAADPSDAVVRVEEVDWQQLNPARGDSSPKAATLWGDRNGAGPTGFLVQFVDGFSSPPHIHNVSYRGMVISGHVHNDDPNAAHMWMPTGSFWTQPKGAVHITAAKGPVVRAYIEIEEGPYLVHPVDEAFASDQVPVNVDVSNLVWLDSRTITWMARPGATSGGAKVALLWGDPEDAGASGSLISLESGFSGSIHPVGSSLRAVLVQGQTTHGGPGRRAAVDLEPGSYFASTGGSEHRVSCVSQESCVLYVRSEGTFRITTEAERLTPTR